MTRTITHTVADWQAIETELDRSGILGAAIAANLIRHELAALPDDATAMTFPLPRDPDDIDVYIHRAECAVLPAAETER